uniref:Cytoplasmic tRNA 2-thiolation protein 2 n=1 Tax=Chromera velia CCMP2878 TaxID=1169474 RepID=A0A0G4HHM3_9ALVE|eukprot:Cvel_6888.t1-p1 / transcript=Cvel_6888.t1 / gene=Cvel_6888 / organism=Chromera_velia_CCMP2878 / gene_product=hypothetical protein / transcript_product=hypothetical protein / location=Cvel_scaffold348:48821-51769(-) / protein_length=549 / sequence_SO=supercontig / SO=protein_coding / is_pseudo=false
MGHSDIAMAETEAKRGGSEGRKRRAAAACYKCGEAPAVVCVPERACRNCFHSRLELAVKSAMRQGCGIGREDPVFICVSGGATSQLLMHLLHFALTGKLSGAAEGKVFGLSVAAVVHVDFRHLLGRRIAELGEREETVWERLKSESEGLSFSFECLPAGFSLYAVEDGGGDREKEKEKREGELRKAFGEAFDESPGMAETLMKIIWKRDVAAFAEQRGVRFGLMGTSADALASSALSATCGGGGINVPYESGLTDERFEGLVLCRPFRSLTLKELGLYYHARAIPPPVVNPFVFEPSCRPPSPWSSNLSGEGGRASLPSLCADLLASLQAGKSSTVSIVNRTAEKVKPPVETDMDAEEGAHENGGGAASSSTSSFFHPSVSLVMAGALGPVAQRLMAEVGGENGKARGSSDGPPGATGEDAEGGSLKLRGFIRKDSCVFCCGRRERVDQKERVVRWSRKQREILRDFLGTFEEENTKSLGCREEMEDMEKGGAVSSKPREGAVSGPRDKSGGQGTHIEHSLCLACTRIAASGPAAARVVRLFALGAENC